LILKLLAELHQVCLILIEPLVGDDTVSRAYGVVDELVNEVYSQEMLANCLMQVNSFHDRSHPASKRTDVPLLWLASKSAACFPCDRSFLLNPCQYNPSEYSSSTYQDLPAS
jgi:hypothetical protein